MKIFRLFIYLYIAEYASLSLSLALGLSVYLPLCVIMDRIVDCLYWSIFLSFYSNYAVYTCVWTYVCVCVAPEKKNKKWWSLRIFTGLSYLNFRYMLFCVCMCVLCQYWFAFVISAIFLHKIGRKWFEREIDIHPDTER